MAFTPKSGLEPKGFGGREKELQFFDKKLREAENGKCDHFLVLGEWGMGKTVLLDKFKKRSQDKGFHASKIVIRKFREDEDLSDATGHLVGSILTKLPVRTGTLEKLKEHIGSLDVKLPLINVGFDIEFDKRRKKPDPQVFLFESLRALWEDLKDRSKVIPILIDDVQHFDKISEVLTLLKNVLSDDEMVKTGYLFILSCTPDSWSKFMLLHDPIGRYFKPQLTLERLSKQETLEVVDKTLEGTGVEFDLEIREMIYEYTQGHPYELQELGDKLYSREIKGKVTEEQWVPALTETLLTLGKEVWDRLYDEASESEQEILCLMSRQESPISRKSVVGLVKKHKLRTSEASISKFLARLVEKKLLSKPKKFEYAFPDRLFREYVLRVKGLGGERNVL